MPTTAFVRRDLYADVTDKIIADLEKGTVPWVKPWSRTAGGNVIMNAATKRPYSGVNVMMLWSAMFSNGYTVPRFVTFKQALELGGNVRKGEHGTKVYFVKQLRFQDKPEIEGESGDIRAVTMLREYTVFNVAQCENLPERVMTIAAAPVRNADERDATADEFMLATGARITEGQGEAYYRPGADDISLPAFERFHNRDCYYNTAFHELGHWTGAKKRCNRDLRGRFGDHAYAAEELIAELTAAFLCAEFGFDNEVRSADYIGHWLKLLRSDKKAIFTAASQAQKAADYLRGLALAEPEAAAA